MITKWSISSFACALALTTTAHAQEFTYTLTPPAWSAVINNSAMYRLHLDRLQDAILEESNGSGTGSSGISSPQDTARSTTSKRPDATSSVVLSTKDLEAGTGSAIADLASNYPAGSQPEVAKIFRELLDKYGEIERQLHIPRGDLGGAVAALLAGGYMAYKNVSIPDDHYRVLVRQMQKIIEANNAFQDISHTDKVYMFEQFATLGTFMASTQLALTQKPNQQISRNLRAAAKDYLENLTKTEADSVRITARGLTLQN